MASNGRPTTSKLADVVADCCTCTWRSSAANALATAARHHDATGHAVIVDLTRTITYGDPSAAPAGQDRVEL